MITVRCLACVVASLTASALGVTIDYTTIGNPGNAPNTNGWGAVSASYKLATYETPNAQYAEFLNRIDAAGTNPNGIYNASMGSDALGGITFNSGASSGSKYSVKAGTNPNNVPYGNAPVAFATWFSAARFVNWLSNGQSASAASMENGTYTLNNQTDGAIGFRVAEVQAVPEPASLPLVGGWGLMAAVVARRVIRLTLDARARIRLGAAHARRRTLATAMRLSRRRRRPGVGSGSRARAAPRCLFS